MQAEDLPATATTQGTFFNFHIKMPLIGSRELFHRSVVRR